MNLLHSSLLCKKQIFIFARHIEIVVENVDVNKEDVHVENFWPLQLNNKTSARPYRCPELFSSLGIFWEVIVVMTSGLLPKYITNLA